MTHSFIYLKNIPYPIKTQIKRSSGEKVLHSPGCEGGESDPSGLSLIGFVKGWVTDGEQKKCAKKRYDCKICGSKVPISQ